MLELEHSRVLWPMRIFPALSRHLMAWWRRVLAVAFSEGISRRAFGASLVVGTILNLINRGDALWGSAEPDYLKALLTFVVPYCVTTYGAVSIRLDHLRNT